ncbi:uncharacterized protein [Miscanthus floridulus]|uniref:uncharacterized protein n=1 Tax=Miscanthus floridulus TaxID=154761 RepID=UPI0034585084
MDSATSPANPPSDKPIHDMNHPIGSVAGPSPVKLSTGRSRTRSLLLPARAGGQRPQRGRGAGAACAAFPARVGAPATPAGPAIPARAGAPAAPTTPTRRAVRMWRLRPPRCGRACAEVRLRGVPCAAVVTRARTTCCAWLRCSTGRRRFALPRMLASRPQSSLKKIQEGGESPRRECDEPAKRRAAGLVHWRVPAQGLSPAILRHPWLSPVSRFRLHRPRRPLALRRGNQFWVTNQRNYSICASSTIGQP